MLSHTSDAAQIASQQVAGGGDVCKATPQTTREQPHRAGRRQATRRGTGTTVSILLLLLVFLASTPPPPLSPPHLPYNLPTFDAPVSPIMTPAALSQEQTHALFDILSHHETYAEIEAFKFPDAVTGYGHPFARTTVVPQAVLKSRTSTPVNSVPGTPRVRTPAPLPKPAADKGRDGEEPQALEDVPEEDPSQPSTSPLLQTLLSRFALQLPGLRDLPRDFWSVRIQGILARLGEAELSESYDKGALGTRKVLATAGSALFEMIGRGALGGMKRRYPPGTKDNGLKSDHEYDHTKAEDLARAWDNVVEGHVYGTLIDDLYNHLSTTDDLEGYSPAVKASAEYAIIHLATFLHYIFVLSPEGQYVLKLLENVHNLVPYKMVKQTLRVGNAATMMSGMMRLLLAKLSVTSITNWVGLTANADDGMNLLQRIISLVLSWDAGEFRKSADKIEKAKDRPSDEMLQAIRQHVAQGRDEHETVRAASEEHSQSIITAIFNASNPDLTTALTDETHAQCLEYYSALLSVRDRESITAALCRQPPDLFTATVRDLFTAYEPMIRSVHAQIDLREHLDAGQAFIDDFIKASKPKKAETGTSTPLGGMRSMINGESSKPGKMPSVDDYVDLLMRNRIIMYKWIHALAKSCPEVWEEMRSWEKEAIVHFRQDRSPRETDGGNEAKSGEVNPEEEFKERPTEGKSEETDVSEKPKLGAKTKPTDTSPMEDSLNQLFQSLPAASQQPVLAALDTHSTYLSTLSDLSISRLQRILDTTGTVSDNMAGPGMYLSKWQSLVECTPITPGTPRGAVRCGKDVKHAMTMGKTGVAGIEKAREAALRSAEEVPEAPNVDVVVKEMGAAFRTLLQGLGKK
ncbi:hypothetical protein AK830_g10878 [Neonectria ditissima]|uniref:Uncharacterized protein n=1 Tax=Neonectria ditissima TaxID=78410 RepID=A0A0P7ANV2_9HYPO|nr:hypothetical protein AK830_g10878 [Neonectria ditissima]